MDPDPAGRLHRRAVRVGRLAEELTAATPERSEGTDATGRVIVVLGTTGSPVEIRVRDGWRQRVDADRLGAAVLEAHGDAVRRAMRTWIRTLDDTSWWRRQRHAEQLAGEDFERPVPPAGGRTHLDAEYGEQVVKVLRATRHPIAETGRVVTGTDGHHVSVQLREGVMTGCVIASEWAQNRSGTVIGVALAKALKRATGELGVPKESDEQSEIDALLSDALATLADFTDRYRRRGDMR